MKRKQTIKHRLIVGWGLLLVLVLAACGQETTTDSPTTPEEATLDSDASVEDNQDTQLSIVTTFYPVYEFTKQVAGDRANVSQMISGGTDAHHYEPSARDIAMVNEADMFIYSSEEMETWVPSLLDSLDSDEVVVVRKADTVDELTLHSDSAEDEDDHDHEDGHSHSHEVDPHIWLDPVLAQDQVTHIKEALIALDPEGTDYYEERAEQFNQELQMIHEEYSTAFEGAENRVFFTQHEAFGYLANRYDLTQIAVGGLSTEVEPNPARIAEINELVNEYDVPVIYYQEGASSAIAEMIANETGTETAVLYDLERLSTNLQEEGLGYIDAMRMNLESLRKSIY